MFNVRLRGDKAEIEAFAAWVNANGGEMVLQGAKLRDEGFYDVYGMARMPGGSSTPPPTPVRRDRPVRQPGAGRRTRGW